MYVHVYALLQISLMKRLHKSKKNKLEYSSLFFYSLPALVGVDPTGLLAVIVASRVGTVCAPPLIGDIVQLEISFIILEVDPVTIGPNLKNDMLISILGNVNETNCKVGCCHQIESCLCETCVCHISHNDLQSSSYNVRSFMGLHSFLHINNIYVES